MHELRKHKLVICGLNLLELTAELQPPLGIAGLGKALSDLKKH